MKPWFSTGSNEGEMKCELDRNWCGFNGGKSIVEDHCVEAGAELSKFNLTANLLSNPWLWPRAWGNEQKMEISDTMEPN